MESPSHREQLRRTYRQEADLIDELLPQLSPWALLYLRTQLRQAQIQLSAFIDLPPELICEVGQYLELEDVLNCRLVSSAWNERWTHDAVLVTLCRRFFPGLLESKRQKAARDLFFNAVHDDLRWRNAPRCMEMISWDMSWDSAAFENDCTPPSSAVRNGPRCVDMGHPVYYAQGKIAWQPQAGLIFIDDLHTRTRQRCVSSHTTMSGLQLRLEGLSTQLVVLGGLGPRRSTLNSIHVWHLRHKGWKSFSLPGPYVQCFAEGETVGVVTRTGLAFYWTWGGSLAQLDLGGFDTRNEGSERMFGGLPKLIVHPTRKNVVYGVWTCLHRPLDKGVFSFVVVRFEDGQAVWRSAAYMPSPVNNPDPNCTDQMLLGIRLVCEKADNHGSYTLALSRDNSLCVGGSETCDCVDPAIHRPNWTALCFNVLSQGFSHYQFDVPSTLGWIPSVSYDEERLMALKNQIFHPRLWNRNLMVSWFADGMPGTFRIKMEAFPQAGCAAAPGLSDSTPTILDDRDFSGHLFQDDNFLILTSRRGMLVWHIDNSESGTGRRSSWFCDVGEAVVESLPIRRPHHDYGGIIQTSHSQVDIASTLLTRR